VDSIKRVVEEAELMAGVEIGSAYVGIAGTHIRGFNSRGVIAVSSKNRTIEREDVRRAVEAAKAVAIPMDREILHVLPQEFVVDDQDGIGDPIGMTGTRLEVNVHVITCSTTAAQNTVTCVNRAGLEVIDTVLTQMAAAEACLTPDEKELGVALVDIGGGTTDLAIFEKGSLWHTAVLQVGGEHFTNDVAVALRTPVNEAEKIKKKHGCALTSLIPEEDSIEVPSVGGRKPRIMARQVLGDVLQARAEEICGMVLTEIRRAGYDRSLNSGLVLTGGGGILEGMPELAGADVRHARASRHALGRGRAGGRGGEPGLLHGGGARALPPSQPFGPRPRRRAARGHGNVRPRHRGASWDGCRTSSEKGGSHGYEERRRRVPARSPLPALRAPVDRARPERAARGGPAALRDVQRPRHRVPLQEDLPALRLHDRLLRGDLVIQGGGAAPCGRSREVE
jgi:cell division protein FtsA